MHKFDKISIETILCYSLDTYLIVIIFILCTSGTNVKCCRNFVKIMILDFFVYVLSNYEKKNRSVVPQ